MWPTSPQEKACSRPYFNLQSRGVLVKYSDCDVSDVHLESEFHNLERMEIDMHEAIDGTQVYSAYTMASK